MNTIKGFTGIKDQDREILFKNKNDNDLLKVCSLNKYFYYELCNDMFFRNRLARTYPDTLKYKPEDMNWKHYFLRTIYYIGKMKHEYNYTYEEGNLKKQCEIFKFAKNDKNEMLFKASEKGELLLAKEALKRGADIHTEEDAALRLASMNGHLEIVKYLVENGANIYSDDDFALITASEFGHLEIVKYLVENGGDIHTQDEYALRAATLNGHLEIVKYLVENGTDIHAKNDKPLRLAIKHKHIEMVKYLLSLSPSYF